MSQGYLTMLSIGNYGRFCNGAFQIAGVLGIARKNGLTPVFPLWQNKDHRDRFGSNEDVDVYKHMVNPLALIPEGLTFQDKQIEWGYHNVNLLRGNWNLSGHFQSERYFAHCLDEVRFYMRMVDEPPQNDYVAIHVRLGDYDNVWHPRLGMDYYAPAMAQFPGAKFLVFSDDLGSAFEMFGDNVEYARGNYIQDFKLIKKCRHFIIGNSSYSAFAAILGEAPDKRVVAPFPWFGPNWHPSMIANRDIYSDGWTVINWEHASTPEAIAV